MFQAIGAIFGFATSANSGAQAQYAMQRSEYANSLGFSQAKDYAFYDAYSNSVKQIVFVSVLGFVLLGFILYMLLKNK